MHCPIWDQKYYVSFMHYIHHIKQTHCLQALICLIPSAHALLQWHDAISDILPP